MKPQQLQPEEREAALLDEIKPRLDNWRRAYRDKCVKNISITYAVERALALTRNKTDFSEDYTGPEDHSDDWGIAIDQKDADLLNYVWQNLSTPGTEVLSVGVNGLNVRTAKLIIAIYTFAPEVVIKKLSRNVWKIRDRKANIWVNDALIFFALRVRFYEKNKQKRLQT